MKGSDIVNGIKDWWDRIPGWHERIIWMGVGSAITLGVRALF